MSDPFKTDDIFKGARVDDFKKENAELKSRIKELESELEAEREVVDFYANEENWEDCWIDGCAGSEDYFTSIKSDMGSRVGGHRARARQKDRRICGTK